MNRERNLLDPLAGWRKKIADFETSLIRYPADQDCPVKKGQTFHLRGCSITIESVKRKLIPGKVAEWHVSFVRHEDDRVYLLRQSPPVHANSEHDQHINISAQERARRDGQYTSSSVSAVPQEPESVGPEWKDPTAEARRARLAELRAEVTQERQAEEMHRRIGRKLSESTVEDRGKVIAKMAQLLEVA
jgi:hypothetical protein